MSTESVTVPAAGWYPDPVQPGSKRWWSGTAWTEHTSAPSTAEPTLADDDAPDLSRFTRDRVAQSVSAQVEALSPARDPYRDRNLLAGLALIVAILSVPGTILSLVMQLPDIVNFAISGLPISLALLGLVASFKLAHRTGMAWLAVGISATTMIAGWVISAQQFDLTLDTPSVTDVPGVTEIQQLENENQSDLGG